MLVFAKLSNLSIAPRKTRAIIQLLRGKSVLEAERILSFLDKRGSLPILKLLKSAVANAESQHRLSKENLKIQDMNVTDGVTMKRFRPRAFGRAYVIRKRRSHVTVVLSDIARSAKASDRSEQKKEHRVSPRSENNLLVKPFSDEKGG